jgi:hypothetical protein
MRTVLVDRADFSYVADLEPVPELPGRYALRVSSVWRQAKDPGAERVKLEMLLDRGGLEELQGLIRNVLPVT